MSRTINFKARFAYVADDNTLRFTHNDKTLAMMGSGGKAKTGPDEFIVKMPKGMPVDDSILDHVGYDCEVVVRARYYTFTSQYDYNKGERVSGTTYFLCGICH